MQQLHRGYIAVVVIKEVAVENGEQQACAPYEVLQMYGSPSILKYCKCMSSTAV